jgi:hypothetical protein
LRFCAFPLELGDGFQVPPAGTLGTRLPLACEFRTQVEDVLSMPFFCFASFCFAFGTHVPEDVPSMPFFGFASFCFAPGLPSPLGDGEDLGDLGFCASQFLFCGLQVRSRQDNVPSRPVFLK